MRESESPFADAVVAAPIRKLCEEYADGSRFENEASVEIAELSIGRERGDPEDKLNSRRSPVACVCDSSLLSARAGQREGWPLGARRMEQPCLKGSVFEDLIVRT